MNERKLNKLFELARGETPPAAPDGFDARILAAIRREQRAAPLTWWDQLGALFPRLAFAAVMLIGLCLAADYYYSARHPSNFAEDASRYSDQSLFASNGDGS
jgi:hypothetical protein